MIGIPASKMMDSEKNKVLAMGSKLKERVVGQDEAIEIVTQSIQRSRAGLNDPSKPIASMGVLNVYSILFSLKFCNSI